MDDIPYYTFRREAIAGDMLWWDEFLLAGLPFCSDAFLQAFGDAGLLGMCCHRKRVD